MSNKRPLLIGIGNDMRGDDGVGPWVARQVAAECTDIDVLMLRGNALKLLDAWEERDQVIMVDAVISGKPAGTVHEVALHNHGTLPTSATLSSHSFGVAEAVKLARRMNQEPVELWLFGIEIAELRYGEGMCPTVTAAAEQVKQTILKRFHINSTIAA